MNKTGIDFKRKTGLMADPMVALKTTKIIAK